MGIWSVGTSNQLFKRVLRMEQNFQNNEVVTGKTPSFARDPFCTHHSNCLNIGF